VLAEAVAAAVVGAVMMVVTEGRTEGKSKEMSHAALRCLGTNISYDVS
jgi:hypothetical protein